MLQLALILEAMYLASPLQKEEEFKSLPTKPTLDKPQLLWDTGLEKDS